jgi:hypothetical protein
MDHPWVHKTQNEENKNKKNKNTTSHHTTQTRTNNVNKTWAIPHTTRGLPFASRWVHPRLFGGVRDAHMFSALCCPIICLYVLSSVLWCSLRFLHINDVCIVFTSSCMWDGSNPIYVICSCLRSVVWCCVLAIKNGPSLGTQDTKRRKQKQKKQKHNITPHYANKNK